MSWSILNADARHIPLADESVQCVVTSPPYWNLRDYGTARWEGGDEDCNHMPPPGKSYGQRADRTFTLGEIYKTDCGKCCAIRIDAQIGLEKTPEEYVAKIVEVFREVWRVLRKDGTVWLNLGDSYAGSANSGGAEYKTHSQPFRIKGLASKCGVGLKPKDLVGIPWRVAFALQAAGWWLRSDIIWGKPNPMPESVTDRPTKAHEYIFLLAKSAKYYFDQDAVREPGEDYGERKPKSSRDSTGLDAGQIWNGFRTYSGTHPNGRNIRSVWEIATQPFPEAHFATFPEEIPIGCIKAGSKPGDIVLDPFAGAGTTPLVADKLGRVGIGLELKWDYVTMAHNRCFNDAPLLGMLDG